MMFSIATWFPDPIHRLMRSRNLAPQMQSSQVRGSPMKMLPSRMR